MHLSWSQSRPLLQRPDFRPQASLCPRLGSLEPPSKCPRQPSLCPRLAASSFLLCRTMSARAHRESESESESERHTHTHRGTTKKLQMCNLIQPNTLCCHSLRKLFCCEINEGVQLFCQDSFKSPHTTHVIVLAIATQVCYAARTQTPTPTPQLNPNCVCSNAQLFVLR